MILGPNLGIDRTPFVHHKPTVDTKTEEIECGKEVVASPKVISPFSKTGVDISLDMRMQGIDKKIMESENDYKFPPGERSISEKIVPYNEDFTDEF